MKNVTLSIDEDVLAAVRRYAAAHDSTVNALVREYLTDLAKRESQAANARRRLRELSDESPARVGSRNWSRDDLHER